MRILDEHHNYGQTPIVADRNGPKTRRRDGDIGVWLALCDTSVPTNLYKEFFMGMMQEFKEFAIKGNAVDLAVGVIIGGAFGKIVDSIVGDLIMPLVSAVVGKVDFSNLFLALGTIPAGTDMTLAAIKKAGVPVFAYGSFITIAVNFAILAFIVFMMVKQLNRLKKEEPVAEAAPPAVTEDVLLLREIRDSLRK
jgi:large conductance mechanosensitive channel